MSFSKALLSWYEQNQRELPWRLKLPALSPPYHVWLSEIMLQQTIVVSAIPYFFRFIEKWPSIEMLAEADIDEVLYLWQGLGYYRRAHNLHKTAKLIASEYKGLFPSEEHLLLSLPGIGPYSASAIGAIAFNQKRLVIDGNVERVLARLFVLPFYPKEDMPKLRSLLETLLPVKDFSAFAQAMMELGAMICTPRTPKCELCPVIEFCQAYREKTQLQFPVSKPKKDKPKRFAYVFWIEDGSGNVWIRKRQEKLLQGLMELPSSPWVEEPQTYHEALGHLPDFSESKQTGKLIKHVFTHFELQLEIVFAQVQKPFLLDGIWSSKEDLHRHAFPSLMHKVIQKLQT